MEIRSQHLAEVVVDRVEVLAGRQPDVEPNLSPVGNHVVLAAGGEHGWRDRHVGARVRPARHTEVGGPQLLDRRVDAIGIGEPCDQVLRQAAARHERFPLG